MPQSVVRSRSNGGTAHGRSSSSSGRTPAGTTYGQRWRGQSAAMDPRFRGDDGRLGAAPRAAPGAYCVVRFSRAAGSTYASLGGAFGFTVMLFAGMPTFTWYGRTSFVATAIAPTIPCSPTCTPARIVAW